MAPKTAKALLLVEKHGDFKRTVVEIPALKPGEILVKNHAIGLNPADWKIQKFFGDFIKEYPVIIGLEAAGTIEELAEDVSTLKRGDRVLFNAGYFDKKNAAHQEYTIVPADIATKIPDHITFDGAAGVAEGSVTAAFGLYNSPDEHGLGLSAPWEAEGKDKYAGNPLLVLGGASCVGQYAIQFGRLSGFSPIITTASSHNAEYLKSIGATEVIDRKSTNVGEALKKYSPFKYVYDAISLDETFALVFDTTTDDAKIAVVLPLTESFKDKVGNRTVTFVQGSAHMYRASGAKLFGAAGALTGYLEQGLIKPMKVEVIPGGLDGIVDGLDRLEKGEVSARKLVVRPQETKA